MKKLAFISDLIFAFFMAFILFAVLFRALSLPLWLILFLASVCALLTTLALWAFWRSRRKTEFLKRSEERQKEKLLLHLALSDDESNCEFFKKLFCENNDPSTVKRTGRNRISTEKALYFLHLSFAPVTADEVADAARVKTNRQKILLCSKGEENALLLCKRLHIEVKNADDIFLAVKQADAFPEHCLGEEELPPKKPFTLWFSRKNAKRFLISGGLVLLLSGITPFHYYYLVFGLLLLLAALLTRIFGKE